MRTMPSKHRLSVALASAFLPACIFLTDLDSLSSAPASDASADVAAVDAASADAPSVADASCGTVCESFDHGTDNPRLVYPSPNDPSGLAVGISNGVALSPPSSLGASLLSVPTSDPHEAAFLVATPPSGGKGMEVRFAFDVLATDYVIFGFFECQTAQGPDGIVLGLTPGAAITLAHDYNTDVVEIGNVKPKTFTPILLRWTQTATSLVGSTQIGSAAPVPFERPIACNGDGQRVRLGIEGSGGRASVAFDDLVYDVLP